MFKCIFRLWCEIQKQVIFQLSRVHEMKDVVQRRTSSYNAVRLALIAQFHDFFLITLRSKLMAAGYWNTPGK